MLELDGSVSRLQIIFVLVVFVFLWVGYQFVLQFLGGTTVESELVG